MTKGMVSKAQITIFENKMDFIVTSSNKLGKTKLFYYTSKGHGMLTLVDVNKVANKKEGYVELYNADEFVVLANKYGDLKGYISANTYKKLSQNPASLVLTKKELRDRAENYLYNEINSKVMEYLKTLPTETDINKLYAALVNFKSVYSELHKLPKMVVFDYSVYGFTEKEKKRAKDAISELLSGVAQELGFTLIDNHVDDNTVMYMLAGSHNMLQPQPVVVYKKMLQSFCIANPMYDEHFIDITRLLYLADKTKFVTFLSKGNHYKGISAFIGELDKAAHSLNLVGLKDWFDYAKGLEVNKKMLTEFVKGDNITIE